MQKIYSAQVVGLKTHIITIEVDLFKGFHTFTIVGLPDKAVEESRDRLSSAIKSIGFVSPKGKSQKVVISLAPADLKKEGPLFDLPMAIAYLLAKNEIRFDPKKKLFVGELSLGGELRPIKGALPIAQKAKEKGFEELYLPLENAPEAALIEGIKIYGIAHFKDAVKHLNEKRLDEKLEKEFGLETKKLLPRKRVKIENETPDYQIDFSDIKEQYTAKRGLEIAAAGGHNIAFFGPPGTGKTLLAKAFISILPPLSFDEALEVTGIHSVVGGLEKILITEPPFRSPHHTASYISIIGGGTFPKPGEATLAHRGVLFLDEFPEFDRRVIESLRQPLEDGVVHISRAKGSEIFPASFILLATLNPCPCGYRGDQKKECICTQGQLLKYQRKISGPIIDRIDMWIEVPRIEHEKLSGWKREKDGVAQKEMREKVLKARNIQKERFSKNKKGEFLNSKMGVRELETFVTLSPSVKTVLDTAAKRLDLSPRSYHRVIKLSRTIADLDQNEHIEEKHILEAIQYRPKQTSL